MKHIVWGARTDTWGISGPTFELCYLTLIGLVWVSVILARRWLSTHARYRGEPLDQHPYLVAYLHDQTELTLLAALSALRVAGLVSTKGGKIVAHDSDTTTDRHPLERAILEELARSPAGRVELQRRARVRAVFTKLRGWLQREGLFALDVNRGRARWCALATVPVVALGVVRLADGVNAHKPVLFLLLSIMAAVILGIVLWSWEERRLHPLRDIELTRLRHTHAYLGPDYHPSWTAYGPQAAALAVALFGAAALWQADPEFAFSLGAPRVTRYRKWVSSNRVRVRAGGRSGGYGAGRTAGIGTSGCGGGSSWSAGGGDSGFSGCGG